MIYDNGRSHIFGVEGGSVVRHDAAHLQQGNLKIASYQLMWDTSQASRSQEREFRFSQIGTQHFSPPCTLLPQNVPFYQLNLAAGSRCKHRSLFYFEPKKPESQLARRAVGFLSTSRCYRRTVPAGTADFPLCTSLYCRIQVGTWESSSQLFPCSFGRFSPKSFGPMKQQSLFTVCTGPEKNICSVRNILKTCFCIVPMWTRQSRGT